jgi:hypothetical protein
MQIAQKPFIYNFSGVEPDYKACRLSEAVKERIWRSYTDNPEPVTIDRLAKEYRIRKQRVHAIIWLKDIEKQEEAAQGSPLENDIEEYFERIDGLVFSASLWELVWGIGNCDGFLWTLTVGGGVNVVSAMWCPFRCILSLYLGMEVGVCRVVYICT